MNALQQETSPALCFANAQAMPRLWTFVLFFDRHPSPVRCHPSRRAKKSTSCCREESDPNDEGRTELRQNRICLKYGNGIT